LSKPLNIKKICFVEPGAPDLHIYKKFPVPRIGSVLLGTILRDLGYDVKVYIEDCQGIDYDEVFDADLVGISAITSTIPKSYKLADQLKEAGIPVVIGGFHTHFLPEEALEHAPYIVRGEGEETIVEFVHALENGDDLSNIKGLSYLEDGQPRHNPDRPLIMDLDVNPIPDFSLVFQNMKRPPVLTVQTKRGCPYDCSFCTVTTHDGKRLRKHSVGRVIEMLKYYDSFEPHYLFFADDIFNLPVNYTKELLREMVAQKITPRWGAQVRQEAAFDPELLKLMRESNCDRVYVGFESVSQESLNSVNKKTTVEEMLRAIENFRKYKIKIHGMFIGGMDTDTPETIRQIPIFAKKNKIDTIQIMILTHIPGSRCFNEYVESDKEFLTDNWESFDGHHVTHQHPNMTPYELEYECMKGMKDFYTLSSVFKSILKLDLRTAYVRYQGLLLSKEWFKNNKSYLNELKNRVYNEIRELFGNRLCENKPCSITITPTGEDKKFRKSLELFFHELGVKVIESEPVNQITQLREGGRELLNKEKSKVSNILENYVKTLSDKVDLVIVPLVDKVEGKAGDRLGNLSDKIISVSSAMPKIIHLPERANLKSSRKTFIQIGLFFTDDLERIQSAFYKTLANA